MILFIANVKCFGFYMGNIIIIIIIAVVIIFFLLCEFFTPILTGGFYLKSE